jgi:methylphosphotriester-DNA--protein-cysteine methyltransferase
MIWHREITNKALRSQIRQKKILWAGNMKLRIYGRLNCQSGKRMKKENRVFFSIEHQAIETGYRPCGHCMRAEYHDWKMSLAGKK